MSARLWHHSTSVYAQPPDLPACFVQQHEEHKQRQMRTCESNAGFTIWQLTNTHRWFLTMKSLTFAFLFFLLMVSTSCLHSMPMRRDAGHADDDMQDFQQPAMLMRSTCEHASASS
jgi:hypothetical protein